MNSLSYRQEGPANQIKAAWQGKTDKNGLWTSQRSLAPDVYAFTITSPGYRAHDIAPLHLKFYDAGVHAITVELVAVRVKVTDAAHANAAVCGVQVQATSGTTTLTGMTDVNGDCPLAMTPGDWTVTLTKPGHAPAGTTTEAPVAQRVTVSNTQTEVAIGMDRLWDRISSKNITVNGDDFVTWFNRFCGKYPTYHETLLVGSARRPCFSSIHSVAAFNSVFDRCSDVWAPELSREEFIAIFLIIMNETGGSFLPLNEGERSKDARNPKYFFEASKLQGII